MVFNSGPFGQISTQNGLPQNQVDPPIEQWSELVLTPMNAPADLLSLRRSARKRLVESGEQMVLRLHEVAQRAGLPPLTAAVLTGNPHDARIIMTGHQPVIFHSGLTFKYQLTEQFAAREHAICVAVVIDTDEGDAGQFICPQPDGQLASSSESRMVDTASDPPKTNASESDSVRIRKIIRHTESLSAGHSLYLNGRLKAADDIASIGRRVVESLRQLQLEKAAEYAAPVFRQFEMLSSVGATMMEANLLTRWSAGIGDRCLELPLSAFSAFPEVMDLTASLVMRHREFAAEYNRLLREFRSVQRIENPANPFPDLDVNESACELPFWVIHCSTGKRERLGVSGVAGQQVELWADGQRILQLQGSISGESLQDLLLQGIQIVPRGALITTFLRLLCSDLFVHGTGGGKYDRFTDELIRSWWKVQPPPFCVASTSRYLLADDRAALNQLEQTSLQLRDLQFNPQRHFGTAVFSQPLEETLKQLWQQKQVLVQQMQDARAANRSGREIGAQIQQVTEQIRSAVAAEFQSRMTQLESLSTENRAAVQCRTWPWIFFTEHAADTSASRQP